MMTLKDWWQNFLKKAKEKWGDRFGYTEAEKEFKGVHRHVHFQCKKHGIRFETTPALHLLNKSGGCSLCRAERKREQTLEARKHRDIIKEFQQVHGDKYDYSEVDFVNSYDNDDKVKIICPTHGAFYMRWIEHLRGYGCSKCNLLFVSNEEFIEAAKKIYGDKYSYEKTEYTRTTNKVTITCREHGCDFQVWPHFFIKQKYVNPPCPVCGKRIQNQEEFILKAEALYPGQFDYSLVEYINAKTPVKIKCKKCGLISQVIPHLFLIKDEGRQFICSCSKSGRSKLETFVSDLLTENGIVFSREHTFSDLIDTSRLRFDYYIESLNLVIECQGNQHFSPQKIYGGEEMFAYLQKHDKMKIDYCKEHGIRLVYYMSRRTYRRHFKKLQSEIPAYYDLDSLKNELKNGE